MHPIEQYFNALLQRIQQEPFLRQEQLCNKIERNLENFIKMFPPYAIRSYKSLFGRLWEHARFSPENKEILEIGPGNSLGLAFLAALSGARTVYAIDAYKNEMSGVSDFLQSMEVHLQTDCGWIIPNGAQWDANRLRAAFRRCVQSNPDNTYAYNHDILRFLCPYSAERLPFGDETMDLVYSLASFEHFRDPKKAVAEIGRVTRSGGYSLHQIDFRDHRDMNKPLEFLAIPDEEWERAHIENRNYMYTNRVRCGECISLFAQEGFTLVHRDITQQAAVAQSVRDACIERFRSLPEQEICILSARLIFQKS